MDKSSRRAALSLGLGLTTILGLFTRARGQSSKTAEPAAAAEPPLLAGIGTLNVGAVLKGYEKVITLSAEFKKDALERQKALLKIAAKAESEAQALQGMVPGSSEYQAAEARIAKLKAEVEAGRQKAQKEFTQKEADLFGDVYKDVREATGIIARRRKLAFVLKIAGELAPTDPNSVFAAMEQSVVYAAPEAEITNEVIALLNQRK